MRVKVNLRNQHVDVFESMPDERLLACAERARWGKPDACGTQDQGKAMDADSDAWWTVIPGMVNSDSGDGGQRFRRMVNTFRW